MIITVTNQKGGTGKTTTSINGAAYLAQLGRKVLLVDLDPQTNATSGLGVNVENGNLYDLLQRDNVPFQDCLQNTRYENLDILPGSPDLAGLPVEITYLDKREFRLHEHLQPIAPLYDYIIIDSPPSLGLITINGLVASDKVLIPVQSEYYALEGLGQLLQTVNRISRYVKQMSILGAVLTMHDRRNRLSHQVAKEMKRHFPGYVFSSIIPRNVSLSEAPSFGKPIHAYAKLSKGAFAYRSLAQEIIGQVESPK